MSELIDAVDNLRFNRVKGTRSYRRHQFYIDAVDDAITFIRQHESKQQEVLKEVRDALQYANQNLSDIDGEDDVTAKALASLSQLISQDEGRG